MFFFRSSMPEEGIVTIAMFPSNNINVFNHYLPFVQFVSAPTVSLSASQPLSNVEHIRTSRNPFERAQSSNGVVDHREREAQATPETEAQDGEEDEDEEVELGDESEDEDVRSISSLLL